MFKGFAKSVAGAVSNATSKGEQGDSKNILKNYLLVASSDASTQQANGGEPAPRFVSGHQRVWSVYDGISKKPAGPAAAGGGTGSNVEVSVFICDHSKVNDRCNGEAERKADVIALLKNGPSSLAKLRHPDVLKVEEGLQEGTTGSNGPTPVTRRRLVYVTERVVGTLESVWREADRISSSQKSSSNNNTTTTTVSADLFGGPSTSSPTAPPNNRESSKMEPLEVMYRLHRLCETLHFLHTNAKVVLCNLSPNSIYLTATGDWRIGDFTFAQPLSGPSGSGSVEDLSNMSPPVGGGGGSLQLVAEPIQWVLSLDQKGFKEPLVAPPLDYCAPEVLGERVIRPPTTVTPGLATTQAKPAAGPTDEDLFGGRISTSNNTAGSTSPPPGSVGKPTDVVTFLSSSTDVFSLGLLTHELVQRWCSPAGASNSSGSGDTSRVRVLRTAEDLVQYRQQLQDVGQLLSGSVAKQFVIVNATTRPRLADVVSFHDPIFASPEVQMLGKLRNFTTLTDVDRFATLKSLYQSVGKLSASIFELFALPPLLSARATDPQGIDPYLVPILIEASKRDDWRQVSPRSRIREGAAGEGSGEPPTTIFNSQVGPVVISYLKSHETLPQRVVLQLLQGLTSLRLGFFGASSQSATHGGGGGGVSMDQANLGAFLSLFRRCLKEAHGKSTLEAPKVPKGSKSPAPAAPTALGAKAALMVIEDLTSWQPMMLTTLGHERWSKDVVGPLLELCDPSAQCIPVMVSSSEAHEVATALKVHQGALIALTSFVDTMTQPEVSFVGTKVSAWLSANLAQPLPAQALTQPAPSTLNNARGATPPPRQDATGSLEERVGPIFTLAKALLPVLPVEALAVKFLPSLCPLLVLSSTASQGSSSGAASALIVQGKVVELVRQSTDRIEAARVQDLKRAEDRASGLARTASEDRAGPHHGTSHHQKHFDPSTASTTSGGGNLATLVHTNSGGGGGGTNSNAGGMNGGGGPPPTASAPSHTSNDFFAELNAAPPAGNSNNTMGGHGLGATQQQQSNASVNDVFGF